MRIENILPGCAYGATTTVFGHPLDTIKTRLQSGMYTSTYQCITKTISNEGILSLYRGCIMPTLSHVIKRSYQFPVFHYLKNDLNVNAYLAGLICGSTGTTLGNPLQVIKVNTQSTTSTKYKNSFDFIKEYYKDKGISGFYKGFKVNCLKDGLFASCYLGNYHMIKLHMENKWYNNFIAGGISNTIAWILLMPLDYIKTQIQVVGDNNKSIKSICKDIYNNKQYKILWRGLTPTLIRIFPVSGLSMVVYEFLKLHLETT
jgi:solute carrier family 25 carnitine/acylcarnitine transporter 20/29